MFADDRVGALFSPDRVYRYRLWRRWKLEEPALVYVMLNPSTADEIDSDATVTRCIERAKRMGYGGIEVVNIFALRSTDPAALQSHQDPVGPENDQHIIQVCVTAMFTGGQIVLAWGKHGALHGRGAAVRKMLDERQINTYALVLNRDGSPKHPLYVPLDWQPIDISPWASKGGRAA
jgi:hypothetical protein